MQGQDASGGEFETGFDPGFEARWHRAELAGRFVMLAVVAAGMLGLLGRGPFSHSRAVSPDGAFSADFEPVARYGTPTQVTIHIPAAAGAEVALSLGSRIVEPMGLQTVLPRPLREEPGRDGALVIRMEVPQNGGEVLVRLYEKPIAIGPQRIEIGLPDRKPLRFTQVVLP